MDNGKEMLECYEGNIIVDNTNASVIINGFKITGDRIFEILQDGIWSRGQRKSSQYGQIFVGEYGTVLLTND